MRSDPAGNADYLLAKGKARLGLLTLALAVFVLATISPTPVRAQNWDGAGGGGYSLPPPPPTQQGVCVANCGGSPPPAAPTYQAPSASTSTYSGPSPVQQQMMQNMGSAYMQGMWNLGTALGQKIRQQREQEQQQEQQEGAARAAQEQAARQAAETAARAEAARRQEEEERRHQQLMANLKGIDGIGTASEPVRLKSIDDASGGGPPGGGPLQLKTGNDLFGTNPPPQADAGAVDLRGAGTTVDPSMVKQGGPCPLDANGMPQCGAPVGEPMPSGNANALPSAASAPPNPPQSAYDNGLSGQARQDAAARSANQASSQEYEDVGREGPEAERATVNAAKVAVQAAEGAEEGSVAGPAGAVGGAALGAGAGVYENYKDGSGN